MHKVRAAVLLMIGSDDLRVAPRQGTQYYHAWKECRNSALGLGGPGEMEQGRWSCLFSTERVIFCRALQLEDLDGRLRVISWRGRGRRRRKPEEMLLTTWFSLFEQLIGA